jgi:hypothetical protein
MIRALNITLRTLHIAAMGILVGGHAFDVAPERLHLSLWLAVGSGAVLIALEAAPRWTWFHELRGVLTLVKVALLFAVPLAWDSGLPILLVVIAIGSVTSHMPRRFRHYSLLYRRVLAAYPSSGEGKSTQ